jgi:hypothetical protein
MPRFDGTGPMGAGPGTGWGLGPLRRGDGLEKRLGLPWRLWFRIQEIYFS